VTRSGIRCNALLDGDNKELTMGMFDELRCKYPLPVPGANELLFQTKDTPEQYMDLYEIREDGSLWHEVYDIEDRSDPNAEGLMALAGCMTRVNKQWEPCDMTGEIRFYTYTDEKDMRGSWVEFSAYMIGGKTNALVQISPEPSNYNSTPK
jgi:hypothetical protein